jgi:hypothetical protein
MSSPGEVKPTYVVGRVAAAGGRVTATDVLAAVDG